MNGSISVINSGSSSIKFSLYDQIKDENLRLLYRGIVENIGTTPHFVAKNGDGEIIDEHYWQPESGNTHENLLEFIIGWIRIHRIQLGLELLGVGHRVVHGADQYTKPVIITDSILQVLYKFCPLAPLHQPHNLSSIQTIMKLAPMVPQVACFDTAFHTTTPALFQKYGLPHHFCENGIKKYGFHGLSYEFVSQEFKRIAGDQADGRTIIAHLGSGASMCGLRSGKSIASSMGFSAMDGLIMGTRPGTLDPGVVLYLLEEHKLTITDLYDLFYKRSGLLGLSGISNDMRILLASEDAKAKEAIDIFVHRIQLEIGSLTAAIEGLDAFIFTAGIGENSAEIRKKIIDSAKWLGLKLDDEANRNGQHKISSDDSSSTIWIIPTNEELMIAKHTRDMLLN